MLLLAVMGHNVFRWHLGTTTTTTSQPRHIAASAVTSVVSVAAAATSAVPVAAAATSAVSVVAAIMASILA